MVSLSVIPDKKSFGGTNRFAFSEQGVAMPSSVLNGSLARTVISTIQINIQIMRVFTRIRQMLTDNTDLRLEIAEIKQILEKQNKKQDGHDKNIDLIFEYIDRLQEKVEKPQSNERKSIGYRIGEKEAK